MDRIQKAIIAITCLLLLTGCAKKAIIGNCEEGDYELFLHSYPEQCIIDSLKGNGSFEMWRQNMDYSGTFSAFYHSASGSWGMDFYGFFGMMLSSIRIKGDSFSVFSPFFDKPMEGLVQYFNIEEYVGIPLDAYSVQLLTTGRAPFDPSLTPTKCVKKNESLEFTYEAGGIRNCIVWSPLKKQVDQFTSGRKDRKELLEVAFRDYKDASGKTLPHSITFTYRGREEAYLKLDYKYIEVR